MGVYMKINSESMLRLDWPVDQDGYEFVEYMEEKLISGPDPTPYMGPSVFIEGKGGPFLQYTPFSGDFAVHRELASFSEDNFDKTQILAFCAKFGLIDHNTPVGGNDKFSFSTFIIRRHTAGGFLPFRELLSLEHFWGLQRDVKEAVQALDDGNKKLAIAVFNRQEISVVPRIKFIETKITHSWQLIPTTLISAIWLLIEQEISIGQKWRREERR